MIFGVRFAKLVGLWALLVICVGLFGLFIWPTPYRYDHIDYGSGTSYPVRQNRLTGSTEVLFPNGWRTVPQEELGPADLGKLDVHAQLYGLVSTDGWNEIKLDLYNGSGLSIREITIEVCVADRNKQPVVTGRLYRSTTGGPLGIQSLGTGSVTFELGFAVMRNYSWSYRVVGAKGSRN